MEAVRLSVSEQRRKLAHLILHMLHSALDWAMNAAWVVSDYYDDLAPVVSVRLRAAAIKLRSSVIIDSSKPLELRLRHLGRLSAGALAVVILAVAPTSAVFQPVQYAYGGDAEMAPVEIIAIADAVVPGAAIASAELLVFDHPPGGPLPVAGILYIAPDAAAGYDGALLSVIEDAAPYYAGGYMESEAAEEAASYDEAPVVQEAPIARTTVLSLSGPATYNAPPAPAVSDHAIAVSAPAAPAPAPAAAPAPAVAATAVNPPAVGVQSGSGSGYMAVGNVGEVIPNPSSESTGSYIWPANGNLSSRFGRRTTTVGSRNHKGIDITGRSGDPIFAADGGEVIVSGWSVSWGNVIRILHDNGDVTLYSHCSALLVKVGDRVSQGQQIARMGRTGVASGVHLHFELIVDGVNVDPLPHLP